MVKFHDPRGEIATEMDVYDLGCDIRSNEGEGITVGLLANGFPDSELFLSKVAQVLEARFPKLQTLMWNKGNAGVTAGEEMLEDIKARCQVAVAAYGH